MPDFAHFDPRNPVKSRPKYFLREGRPIGYELFPGSTFEGKTLEAALEKLEQRFGIRRVIIVADRGLNNKFNLKRIIDKGYGYIVASRIKNMSKRIQEEILNSEGYTELNEEEIRYKIIDYINCQRRKVRRLLRHPDQ